MRGNDSITCLYSGQWSTAPPKCVPIKKSGMKYVYFVLLVISVLLLVVFIFIELKYKWRSSPELKEEVIQLDTILAQLTDNDESLLPSRESLMPLFSITLIVMMTLLLILLSLN